MIKMTVKKGRRLAFFLPMDLKEREKRESASVFTALTKERN